MSEAQAKAQASETAASGGVEAPASWAFVGISPEARRAAEAAAEASGMEVDTWLSQLIKYKSAMELRGREAISLDDVIFQMAPKADTGAAEKRPVSRPVEAPVNGPVSGPVNGKDKPQGDEAPASANTKGGSVPAAEQKPATKQANPDGSAGDDTLVLTKQAAQDGEPGKPPASAKAADTGPETGPASPASAERKPNAEESENGVAAEMATDAPRKRMMPTDALRASRLSAIGKADETEIQHVLDNWRDARSLEPLVVRPVSGERNAFEVIVGVERWYAARRAHVREVPVILHQASDDEAIRLAMSMRLKRGPLSPLAEANTYLSLMSEAHMSTEQVARLVGKPPAHVATMIRVLNLPKSVRQMLERGEITALHARALLDAPNPDAAAREVIAKRLDIYQTEQLVRATAVRSDRAEKVDMASVDLDIAAEEAPGAADVAKTEDPAPVLTDDPASSPSGDFVGAAGEDGLTIEEEDDIRTDLIDETAFDASPFSESGLRPANDRTAAEGGSEDESRDQQRADDDRSAGGLPLPDDDTVSTELLERRLAAKLGLKVAISERNSVGVITLHYSGRDELSAIVSRLNSDPEH